MTADLDTLEQDLAEIRESVQRTERMVKAIHDALGPIVRLDSDQSLKREVAARRQVVAAEIRERGRVA